MLIDRVLGRGGDAIEARCLSNPGTIDFDARVQKCESSVTWRFERTKQKSCESPCHQTDVANAKRVENKSNWRFVGKDLKDDP